jgi:hypothetical protein
VSLGLFLAWICFAAGVAGVEPPDFETQIVPVLTKAGCNSGACHGAAIGRGGFRLSLLGYDPASDYEHIIQEFEGRRANLAHPERSLILRKPGGQLPHEGGVRLKRSSEGYQILYAWLHAGAPRGPSRTLHRLEVTPGRKHVEAPGEKFSLRVQARFSDGRYEDVTRWAVYTPADPAALQCTPLGEVTVLRRGQHSLMVRFLGEVGSVSVTVPLNQDAVGDARPRANWIDEHVNRTLDLLRLPHSPRADDRTFFRRIHLDLIGTLPEPAEVEAFVADRSPDKRNRVAERLLARPEFADLWAYKWGDLLRIESRRLQPAGAAAFHGWVREQLSRNAPLDGMARELLLTLGDGHRIGPANFSRVPADAGAHAEYISQAFLGVRLQCANCHNHPLDRWTQDDYHGLAAVFAKIDRTGAVVKMKPRGEVIHPRTSEPATPRLPGLALRADTTEPREALARWLTDPDNPYFARAAVNRIWHALMGPGLVEPLDDHRDTNPPTHPELLDYLARDFVRHAFDMRHTIRTIVASEAYQRSSLPLQGNRADDRFYSRALVRPLPPHVLVDAVAKVTGVPEQLGNLPAGTRASALGDSRIASTPLDLLGRCSRDAACATEERAGSLALVLHALNGPWLNEKIKHPKGRLQTLLREQPDGGGVITALYEIALNRPPSTQELAHWRAKLANDRTERFHDFLWALLNSAEFGCNH